jgi:DNA repair photolyase
MVPDYQLLTVKSALNRVKGMPFDWSLNPYRGCLHNCAYCYARVTHNYFDLDPGADFARVIFVKNNLSEMLRQELRRPSWRRDPIAIGTATDPYQPAEGTFRITRRCLEVLAEAANPCSITTKGTLLVRDLDVMQELARVADFNLHLSLITLDRDLWQRLEPGAPPPASRLRALERLRAAGVPASVFLMPIVPGITDRPDQLAAVIRAAADHGASEVHPAMLRLAPGVKEWFYAFLEAHFPHLLANYQRGYGPGSNVPTAYAQRLERRVAAAKEGIQFLPVIPLERAPASGRQLQLPVA